MVREMQKSRDFRGGLSDAGTEREVMPVAAKVLEVLVTDGTGHGASGEQDIAPQEVHDGCEIFGGDVVRELKEACTKGARVLDQVMAGVGTGYKQHQTRAQSTTANTAWLYCGPLANETVETANCIA